MKRSTTEVARSLFSQALLQGGYFTVKQAREIGYNYQHIEYHESVGNFERVGHGLYRLHGLPPAEHDDLVRLSLWSRNRADRPQAVVSHASALVLHNLSELLPGETHLTVPRTFRKEAPPGVVLHKTMLTPSDQEERAGFHVTSPLRTLLDAAADGVSQEQLGKAVREALGRGLVRKGPLAEAAQKDARYHRLQRVVHDMP